MKDALELINQHSGRVKLFFQEWHRSVRGEFAQALEAPDAHTRGAAARLSYNLQERRKYHQDHITPYEGGHLRASIEPLLQAAQDDAQVQLPAEDRAVMENFAYNLIDETMVSMRGFFLTDEHAASDKFRRIQLQASLYAQRVKDPRDAFNMAKAGQLQALVITRFDALNRRWNTGEMARRDVRKSLMDIYNNVFMMCLLHDNTEIASIANSEGSKVFSITGATKGIPTYLDVEDMLHPNAEHLVTRA